MENMGKYEYMESMNVKTWMFFWFGKRRLSQTQNNTDRLTLIFFLTLQQTTISFYALPQEKKVLSYLQVYIYLWKTSIQIKWLWIVGTINFFICINVKIFSLPFSVEAFLLTRQMLWYTEVIIYSLLYVQQLFKWFILWGCNFFKFCTIFFSSKFDTSELWAHQTDMFDL